MRREYPEEYNFFPTTYILPYELQEFKNQFLSKQELEEIAAKKHEVPQRKPPVEKQRGKSSVPSTAENTPPLGEKKAEEFVPPFFIVKPECMS